MADRSVVVRLRAEAAGYISSIKAASAATKDFGDEAMKNAAKNKNAWKDVGHATELAGGVLVGIGVAALLASAEFDKAMSTVKANIDDKSVPSMQRLRQAALDASLTTVYSATQVAEAENELAKAGISAADITGGALAAALSLASAGQLDLATAAEITASTMVQFGLAAKDTAHIADLLAAGADKSLGGVTDLAEALKYAGVPAAQFGVSLDTTVGVLAEFASNGLMGSMAGTSFRMMLVRLADPVGAARDEITHLGLSFFDANGKFMGMANLAEQLHTKLSGLTQQQREQALATIFGARSLAEANILYRDGAKGVTDWTGKVNDSGFAAKQAATKLDNLSGDFTKFKNAVQTDLIAGGSGVNDTFRGITQSATSVAKAFGHLDPTIQGDIVKMALLAGTALLMGGAFVTAIPKIQATRVALAEMQATSGGLTSGLVAAGKAIGIVGIAVAGVQTAGVAMDAVLHTNAASANDAGRSLLAYADGGSKAKGVTDLASRSFDMLGSTIGYAFDDSKTAKVKNFFSGLGTLWIIPTNAEDANHFITELDSGLSNLVQSGHMEEATKVFNQFKDAALKQGYTLDEVKAKLPQYAQALAGVTDQQKALSSAGFSEQKSAAETAKSLNEQAKAAADAAKQNDALVKSVEDYGNVVLGARDATRKFYAAVDAASKALHDNGKTLDITTQKGRDNQAALDGIASATLTMVGETFKNRDANTSLSQAIHDATTKVEAGRAAFIKSAEGFGMSKKAANLLADQLGLTTDNVNTLSDTIRQVPTEVNTQVNLNGVSAFETAAATLRAQLASIHDKTVTVSVVTGTANKLTAMDAGGHPARAGGGPVSPGTAYLVGELGPELVTFDHAGTVLPADRTAALMRTGSMSGFQSFGGPQAFPSEVTLVVDGRPMRAYIQEGVKAHSAGVARSVASRPR